MKKKTNHEFTQFIVTTVKNYYIELAKRRVKTRFKEHIPNIIYNRLDKSAIAHIALAQAILF